MSLSLGSGAHLLKLQTSWLVIDLWRHVRISSLAHDSDDLRLLRGNMMRTVEIFNKRVKIARVRVKLFSIYQNRTYFMAILVAEMRGTLPEPLLHNL